MTTIPIEDCDPTLLARLAALRGAAAPLEPPPQLEAALRARLFPAAPEGRMPPSPAPTVTALPRNLRQRTRRATWLERWANWIAWPVSVTAAAGLVSWMVYTNPAVAPEPALAGSAPVLAANGDPATPFLALASLDRIPPDMRGEIVRTSLPRATLAEFGLPVSPLRAAEPIDADFLVGADGGVLAVRFVDDGRP